ncbi:MAG TPA: beta-galactosidase [Kofleriaceae bacterium]
MEARRRTWFDDRGLKLENGRTLPFYAGAMHYWRVPPEKWATCLRTMHSLGLTIVETYVPWRVHDPQGGRHIWTGQRDLGRFLEAAWAAGLSVVLRPGPHVNAELTSFGFPDWVVAEPQCQARTAHGSPAWLPVPPRAFPIPSYASTKFHDHVRTWYAAVAEIVKPYLAPSGPVVAIGVDNEAQLFFRAGPFDLDYHPDALTWWRDASGLDEPPREWHAGDAARCVLWLKHKDEYIARALGAFAKTLDEVGLGEIARFHNLPPGHYGHYDLRRIQQAIGGPVGIDAYTPRSQFPELRRRAAALAGNASPLPLALEVGVGFFPWFPPLDDRDDATREIGHLLTLLASGVRGFNLFMAVERDRYYGAAISSQGRVEATWIKPLLAALAEVDWAALRRQPLIALVDTRADARIGLASNVIDPVTPILADALSLGPGGAAELGSDADAISARRWQTSIARALELAQVPYAIVDEATSEAELAHYRAVIAPTQHRIDRGLWQRLRALAEHKRAVVVIGPSTPTRDELDQPLDEPAPKRIGKLNEGSLDDVGGLSDDLVALAGELSEDWTVERPDDVRTMAYVDAAGATRVVFVVSDAGKPVTAVVLAGESATTLRDPLANETLRVIGGKLSVAMPPRGVRMLIVD